MAKKGVFGPKRPFLHLKKKRPKGQKAFSRNLMFLQLLATFQQKEQKKRKKYGQKRRFLLKKGHCDKKKRKEKTWKKVSKKKGFWTSVEFLATKPPLFLECQQQGGLVARTAKFQAFSNKGTQKC